MTVIVELVLLDNLVIDYLLLKTTFELSGKGYNKKRLLLISALGGIISLLYPLIPLSSGFLLALIKISIGGILLLSSNRFTFFKEIYYNLLIFFALTFISGGGIYFFATSFDLEKVTKYTSLFIIIPVFLIINGGKSLIKTLYRRKTILQNLYEVRFSVLDIRIEERGFYDTGNSLYFNNLPVVVVDKGCFKKIMGEIEFLRTLRSIEVFSVNGKGIKKCFLCEDFCVKTKNQEIKTKVYVCIGRLRDLSGYKIILHPEIFKESYEEFIEKSN